MLKKLVGILSLCVFATITLAQEEEQPKTDQEELVGVWEQFTVLLRDQCDPTSNTLTLWTASERDRREIVTTIPLDAVTVATSEFLNPCCDLVLLKDGKATIVASRGQNSYNHWKIRVERYKRQRENWLATKTLPNAAVVTYKGPFMGLKAVDPAGGNIPAYWEFQLGYEKGAKKVAISRDHIDVELKLDAPLAGTIVVYDGEGMSARAVITYSFESRWAVEVWRDRLAWDGSDDR